MTQTDVYAAVRMELAELLQPMGLVEADIEPSSSLVDDFGMDSLGLVELAAGLERRLHIGHFRMEDWEIDQSLRRGTRYTVESLVAACWDAVKEEA